MHYVNEKIAAAILDLSPKTLRNNRSRGVGLPFIKMGGRILYSMEDINARVQNCRHEPGEGKVRSDKNKAPQRSNPGVSHKDPQGANRQRQNEHGEK